MTENRTFKIIAEGIEDEMPFPLLMINEGLDPLVRILAAILHTSDTDKDGWVEGLDLQAIGRIMQASIPTVRKHIQSALDHRMVETRRRGLGMANQYRLTYEVNFDAASEMLPEPPIGLDDSYSQEG